MSKIICNIPHASIVIPEWAKRDIIISENELNELIEFMVDKNIDRMWEFVPKENKQIAIVSRLIVDTERFRNDEDEPMAIKGMGVYYTHTPNGERFRKRTEESYQRCLEFYDDYHSSLETKVTNCLGKYGECIILDCHSFHDEMTYTDYEPNDFPDVCIGVNGELTKEAEFIVNLFKERGYSVKVNEPFSGSLVPLKYLNDNRVMSVMIELNRRIYKNDYFERVQAICRQIYDKLLYPLKTN